MNNLIEDLKRCTNMHVNDIAEWEDRLDSINLNSCDEEFERKWQKAHDAVMELLEAVWDYELNETLEEHGINNEKYKNRVEGEKIDIGGKIIGVI